MGIFLKSKKTEKVKNIRVEGYGGYFFEIEKILKKWKLYEWEDTVVFFCGRYGGVVRGVVRILTSLKASFSIKCLGTCRNLRAIVSWESILSRYSVRIRF